jgi:hypothetical protein
MVEGGEQVMSDEMLLLIIGATMIAGVCAVCAFVAPHIPDSWVDAIFGKQGE